MSYVGMNRPCRIVNFETLFSRTFYDAHRRSCLIILSVGAERQRLGIFNQINKKFYTVSKKQETTNVTQSLLKDIEAGNVKIRRASNSRTGTLYVLYPSGNDNNGKEIYEISPLGSKQFQSWIVSHYADGNVPSNSEIQAAIKIIERATKDKSIIKKLPVFTRVGYYKDKDGETIYLCPHNQQSKVVRIDVKGWRYTYKSNVPVIFENNGRS